MAGPQQTVDSQDLLEEICALGHAAEIHYWYRNEPRTARTQLIELRDDRIHISKPQCIGAEVVIPGEAPITVYVPFRREIYSFRSRMLRSSVVFDLNDRKRIVGAAIERPARLDMQQRRHDYRVSLAVYDIQVAMHRLAEGGGYGAAPLRADRFRGRLTNISSSGFGVLLPRSGCPRVKLWDAFMGTFELPDNPSPLWLPVQLRHARRVHDGDNVSMGLRISHPDDRFVRRQLQLVNRFITAEQRRQLQGGRG